VPRKQVGSVQWTLAREKINVDFRKKQAREPSCGISVLAKLQNLSIPASENPRIGHSVAEHYDPKPVRRETAYDLFRRKVLRVRIGFVGKRWGEYSEHGHFLSAALAISKEMRQVSAIVLMIAHRASHAGLRLLRFLLPDVPQIELASPLLHENSVGAS